MHNAQSTDSGVQHLSGTKFILGCGVVAILLAAFGGNLALPRWVLAVEVLTTVLALFVVSFVADVDRFVVIDDPGGDPRLAGGPRLHVAGRVDAPGPPR